MAVKLQAIDAEVNAAVRDFAEIRLVEALKIKEKHESQDAIEVINARRLSRTSQRNI